MKHTWTYEKQEYHADWTVLWNLKIQGELLMLAA